MKIKGIIYILLAALIYGFTPLLCAFTYPLGNNGFSMTFFRSFFVIPILYLIIVLKKIDLHLDRNELKALLPACIMGACLSTLFLYTSYKYISIGSATTLHFSYPVFVLMISSIFFKEPIKFANIFVIAVAVIGISCFMKISDGIDIKGVLYAIASGIAYAFFMVALDKNNLSYMNRYKLSFYIAVISVFVLLSFNIVLKQLVLIQTVHSYFYMFIVAILTSIFGIIFFKEGIKLIGATNASIFSLFEPLSSIIVSYIFLGTKISILQMFGCFLIILSVLLLIKFNNNSC